MTKLILPLAATAALAGGLAALPAPAAAQAGDRVSEIIVYGNDPCPRSTDDQVVVCARKPETERYRIPEKLRQTAGRARAARPGPSARGARDRRRDRHQQLLAGRTGRLHRLPDAGHQPGPRQSRNEAATEGTAPEQ